MSLRAFAASEPLDPAAAAPRSLPRPSRLGRSVEIKPPRAQKALESLGIETVGDLLEHLPFRAEQRDARRIADLAEGEEATIVGEVRRIAKRSARRRRMTLVEATIADDSGSVRATWFNQPWLVDRFPPGTRLVLHGRCGARQSFTPRETHAAGDVAAEGLVSAYPATKGIDSTRLRELVHAERAHVHDVVEPLPARLRVAEGLADRPAALAAAHFPEGEDHADDARRRLAFEELFLLELALAARKRARREGARGIALESRGELVDPWLATLPFALTNDQRAAFAATDADLAGERPMQRLLMGEVGSGKTVVALNAMLRAVENGHQAALMAPTETLAEQHMLTLDRLLGGLVPIALLTGSTPAARRRDLLGRLASGELGLLVGTHALIEPAVEFRSLALYVVDEQHRFGVRQRAALDAKAPEGRAPHALHMTATPIPRTLALTVYGDLDATAIHELPAGRKPVETHVVDGARARARAYERIREEISAGRQCFVVCPLVEESEALQAKAATLEAERLAATEFNEHRVELIHGQMPAKDKQAAMAAFAAGEADVLVATSVIEVGIDVPNATVMLIEEAERYGISQLHQLRGRVGRGGHASLCVLFGSAQNARLAALAEERDGFRLAEIDLALRGAGEILGTRQHGIPEFKVARLPDDTPLLERVREHAEALLAADPQLEQPEHGLLRAAAVARFGPDLDPIPA
ncbi:MAG: ATP-dependent DNA helicase RecG [Thermoleophilaceae bacterium]